MLDLLERPTTTVTARPKRNGYMADAEFEAKYPPAYVKIEIDLNNPDPVWIVVHELLHVVLSAMVLGRLDDSLEEVVILSMDKYFYDWIKASPKRLNRWKTLVEKKLAETAATLPDRSLEEMADRRGVEE